MMTLIQKLAANIDAACKAPPGLALEAPDAADAASRGKRWQAGFSKKLCILLEGFKVQARVAQLVLSD